MSKPSVNVEQTARTASKTMITLSIVTNVVNTYIYTFIIPQIFGLTDNL